MPKVLKDIEIVLLARTQVDREAVRKWLDAIGVSDEYQLPGPGQLSDPALLVALAGKRCYRSFEVEGESANPNVTKIRRDWIEYLDNILASGHGSCLEHSSYSFGIEGVSRVFTAEMNRHRAGWAISEQSLRYVRFGEIPYWLPPSIQDDPADDPETQELKAKTRDLFEIAFAAQERTYLELSRLWNIDESSRSFRFKKKVTSLFRRIVGMGVATAGVWTGNLRALRHVLTMRVSEHAEEEICYVFSRICKMMIEHEPALFGDFVRDDDGYWRPKYIKV